MPSKLKPVTAWAVMAKDAVIFVSLNRASAERHRELLADYIVRGTFVPDPPKKMRELERPREQDGPK